jgi:hypothetical protein
MSYCGLYIEHKIYYESVDVGGCEHSRPLLDQNFENFIAPALLYIENFESPAFNARKYFAAPPHPPLNIFIINVLSLIL